MNKVLDEILKGLVVVAIFGLIGGLLTMQLKVLSYTKKTVNEQSQQIKQLKLENLELNQEVSELSKQFTVLTNLTDEQRKNLVASKLSEDLVNTNTEVSRLKGIMLETPERAIKLERFKITQEAKNSQLEADIKRLQDEKSTFYWIIALIVTLFFGFLSLISFRNKP
ncbi:hypothetical protein EDB69_0688 [Vibrio crassostreae]|uniref:hypothetical protein n=1 Tax=Vibrio TaxID=662 RepID=UPI000C864FDF|nr:MULTISPECIES: hypothetical protein [Vibrio]PMK12799.1 hypothetical protein BCU07_08665 [Vibrio sp. 10N.261.54.E10]ROO76024.1 hypothetical protein EDB64_1008 [Vibrio crassostreae]ROP14031.1 hypothetical protein EDB63_1036 [Vibrio crassostreae]ROQ88119.1 hypothetical protein EDB72_1675 [Vibrio crassostreae]RPE94732.1 hypothetical protein EDB68_0765 [Vibrio crassostreae]